MTRVYSVCWNVPGLYVPEWQASRKRWLWILWAGSVPPVAGTYIASIDAALRLEGVTQNG